MINPEIDEYGDKHWYNEQNQLHRTDGPAVEYANGLKSWHQNNKLHRTDGPAIDHPCGSKIWMNNGVYHRLDGPAFEYGIAGVTDRWFVHGREYTGDEFRMITFLGGDWPQGVKYPAVGSASNTPLQGLQSKTRAVLHSVCTRVDSWQSGSKERHSRAYTGRMWRVCTVCELVGLRVLYLVIGIVAGLWAWLFEEDFNPWR